MKVLMISTDESILREGSEAYLRMREYGNLFSELHIILFSKKKETERELRENVFIYPITCFLRIGVPFKSFRKVKKIIRKEKEGWIITTQDPFETGLVGFLVKLFWGIKWQVQVHTDFLSLFFFRQSFLNKIRVFLARLIIGKTDKVRVVSERIKKSLINIGIKEEKIDVLPIVIDVDEIKNSSVILNLKEKFPQFDFIIFTAARLEPEKNLRLALASFMEVLKEYPKTGLIIGGNGSCLEDLKKEAKERGVFEQTVFLGELTFSQMISGMKTADLFINTSVYEGYGLTVVEAMMAGCAVVMTDVGLAGEVLKDRENGLVVPVGNALKMAEAIRLLINNNEMKKEIVERAKITTDKFISKEKYFEKFKEILEL